MIDQIQQLTDWDTLTAAQIESAFAESVTTEDATPRTVSDLVAAVGDVSAAMVVGTIKAGEATNPLLGPALMALSTSGLVLHTDERQAMIDTLGEAGEWGSELIAAVKAIGRPVVSRWSLLGGAGDPPGEAAIQAALDAHTASEARAALIGRVNDAHAAALGLFEDGASPTVEAIKAAWLGVVEAE